MSWVLKHGGNSAIEFGAVSEEKINDPKALHGNEYNVMIYTYILLGRYHQNSCI